MIDMKEINQRLNELEKRLSRLCQLGVVIDVDYTTATVKVQLEGEVTDWVPWMTRRAGGDVDWWAPEVGEHVAVLAPGGLSERAYVDLASYSADAPAPVDTADVRHLAFSDGAVIEYDRAAHHLKAILPAGATTELVSDGGVSIIGNVSVDGDISATGEVSDATCSMSADRAIYNGHNHGGVATGPGNTATPNQSQ